MTNYKRRKISAHSLLCENYLTVAQLHNRGSIIKHNEIILALVIFIPFIIFVFILHTIITSFLIHIYRFHPQLFTSGQSSEF